MDSRRFTVLIVDDTSTNVLILKKTLINAGYDVVSADNGPEGRALAEARNPDLILLDIMMPEEDGFETIAKLKSNARTAGIPVIFLTAISDVDAKVKGFELGAVDFITKPFHPAEIRARTSLHIKLSIATNALIMSQAEKLRQVESAQHSLLILPSEMPDGRFCVHYSSLNEAGGDFYDVLKITDSVIGYFIADISGHDIATSFATSAVKALIRQNCSPIYSPAESMQMVNRVLIDVMADGKYLTASYLTVDRKNLRASVISMGHPPIIHLPAGAGKAVPVSAESDVLGSFSDALYVEHEFKIAKGDRIYLYTDGLIEDFTGGKVWTRGVEGLASFISTLGSSSLEESVETMNSHFKSASGSSGDDVVILGTEV